MEKLVKITNKLWNEKGYNVCALWKMSKITNALSDFTLKPSPCRSSGEAVPKRMCERRNEGAPTPQLRSGRFDDGCAPKKIIWLKHKKRSPGFGRPFVLLNHSGYASFRSKNLHFYAEYHWNSNVLY